MAGADAPAARRAARACSRRCSPSGRASTAAATCSSRSRRCSSWSPRRSCRSAAPTRSLLGAALAALTVCFLWLERLPRRSWIGIAVLGVAVAGAAPARRRRRRRQPVVRLPRVGGGVRARRRRSRFDWGHSYGPLDWPREGSEVLRVDARRPSYWKVENLDEFDGAVWRTSGSRRCGDDAEDDLAEDYLQRPQWTEKLRVTVRRLEGREVVTRRHRAARRGLQPPGARGRGAGILRGLRRLHQRRLLHGDRARPAAVAGPARGGRRPGARAATRGRPADHRAAAARRGHRAADPAHGRGRGRPSEAIVRFPAFDVIDAGQKPVAGYPEVRRLGPGGRALRVSHYAETWRLAQAAARRRRPRPYEYVLAIDRYLQDGFTYSREAGADPARAHRARRVPDRDEERLLPALLGRDGAAAPDGRRARRGSSPASRPAATPTARTPGSSATRTRTPGSRRGSTSSAGSRSTRRRPRPRPAPRSRRSPAAPDASSDASGDARRQRRAHRRRAPRPARLAVGPGRRGRGRRRRRRRDLRMVARAAAAARGAPAGRGGWPAGAGAATRSAAASTGSSPSSRPRCGGSGAPRRRA